jgi:hypothetical protein
MKQCPHQFFETTKITDESRAGEGYKLSIVIATKYGVRVMCAFCGLQRNLWSSGAIEEQIKDKWVEL